MSAAPPGAAPDRGADAATGDGTGPDAPGTGGQQPSSMLTVITRLGVGGSDQRLYDVLDALDRTDHHVVVGADSTDEAIARVRERHRVTVEPSLVRQVDPRRDATAALRLTRELRRGGYPAVMTHQSKAGLVGRVAAAVARTPLVYHSASMASFGPGYGRAQSLVFQVAERVTEPLVDRYFVVGQDLMDRMAANGASPAKLELVRSGIDTAPFLAARDAGTAAARAELDLPAEAGVVCFVGRLDERKGAPRLADLFASIAARSPGPLLFLVAGRGPCADDVERRVDALGLTGSVRLLGHTDRVAQVLTSSDLVLLPSSAEGVPQVLVQAAVTGTPFASFDVDGAREILALGAVGTVAPIGADDVLVAHATSLLGRRHERGPRLSHDVLAQWDRDEILSAYRHGLAGSRPPTIPRGRPEGASEPLRAPTRRSPASFGTSTGGSMAEGPTFIGAGFSRCGTTSLYAYLRAHPDVWMPPLKEITYWDLERRQGRAAPRRRARLRFAAAHTWRDRRGIGQLGRDLRFLARYALLEPSDRWYQALFAPAGDRPCGDLSPSYIRLEQREVEELRRALPRTKVFFMLRDPFDRAWSNARKALAYQHDRRIEDVPDHEIEAYLTSDSFLANCDYATPLRRWRAVIDPDDLFIGYTSDLDQAPDEFFDRLGPFIGVDPEPLKRAQRSTARQFTTGSYGGGIPARWARLLADQLHPMLDELADDLGGEAEVWRRRADRARGLTDVDEAPDPTVPSSRTARPGGSSG